MNTSERPNAQASLLQVTSSAGWGGRETLPLAIHHAWSNERGEARLIVRDGTPLAERAGGVDGVITVPPGRLAMASAVHAAIQQIRYDAVICHFTRDLAALRIGLRGQRQLPLIVIKHVGPGKTKRDLLHRIVYRRVDRLLAVSEYIRRKCEVAYPIDASRTAVWHPGIDTERFTLNADARSRRREIAQTPDDEFVFGYIARITPNKGYEDLIDAAQILHERGLPVSLWIVGGASADEQWYEDELKARVGKHGITDSVRFFGARDDVEQFYSAFDAFVTPSRKEAFGLTTIEAMACHRPVVGFDIAGTAEIVVPKVTGILVEPDGNRSANLADGLQALIKNASLARLMGRAGRDRAVVHFSQAAMMERLYTLCGVSR